MKDKITKEKLMNLKNTILFSILWTMFTSCGLPSDSENNTTDGAPEVKKEVKIKFTTSMGDIVVKLYEDTPKHKENIIKLVNEGYYDGTLFHRVINDFMIQGGDPDSKEAKPGQMLGNGGPDYTIEAEFVPSHFHKKGALCAARQGDQVNPEKRSSGSQFYIVTGKVYTSQELDNMELQMNQRSENQLIGEFLRMPENASYMQSIQYCQQTAQDPNQRAAMQDSINKIVEVIKPLAFKDYTPFKFTNEQREIYTSVGGTPFLDENYTVYGEVVEGIEVAEKIQLVACDQANRPNEDVKIIKAEVVK